VSINGHVRVGFLKRHDLRCFGAVPCRFAAWSSANVFVAFEMLRVSLRQCCCWFALFGRVCGALSSAPRASRMPHLQHVLASASTYSAEPSPNGFVSAEAGTSVSRVESPLPSTSFARVPCASKQRQHCLRFAHPAPRPVTVLLAPIGECGWSLRRTMTATVLFVHASALVSV
jgi:hypothetical protein